MNAESRKKALQYFFEKVVGPLGFKFTPDVELKEFLLDQEVILEAKHGTPFCPCQPLRNDRTRDMKMVCPCIPFHREHFTPYQQGLPAGNFPNSVDYASQGSVKTLVLTPQTGLFHTFGSGFSLGFDVGLQVPIAPSQVTLKSQVNLLTDPQIPAATRQQWNNQYVKPTDDRVRSTLETIGRTIIPTFNVRIGWLI